MPRNQIIIPQLNFDDVPSIDVGLKYVDDEMAFADNVQYISSLTTVFRVNFFALLFCQEGELSLKINSVPYTITKYDGLFVDAQSVVSDISHGNEFRCKIIGLSGSHGFSFVNKSVFDTFLKMKANPVVHFSSEEMQLFAKYYELALSKMENKHLLYAKESLKSLLNAYVLDLVSLISSQPVEGDGEDMMRQGDKIFRKFILLLSHNEGVRLNVSDYAQQLCVSPKYLTSLCLSRAEMTAGQLITQHTVRQIKQHLLFSSLSIKEIAMQLGFDNLSFFGKYVKKHLGESPNNYRRRNNYGK